MSSKRPENTAFKQQRLKSWQPLLTPKSVIPLFFVIGIIFVPIGIVLQMASNNVTEVRFDYSLCPKALSTLTAPSPSISGIKRWSYDIAAKNCLIEFEIPNNIPGPVYIYYRLTSFYQNNRMYVKSFDLHQLAGDAVNPVDTVCSPLSSLAGSGVDPIKSVLVNGTQVAVSSNAVYYPCGLIANSLFSDVISDLTTGTTTYAFSNDSIAWPSDSQKYGRSKYLDLYPTDEALAVNVIPPPFWRDAFPQWKDGYNHSNFPDLKKDQHFQVWMRTAGLPTFRKLYGVNKNQDLASGTYNISIQYKFDTSKFGGTKSIVISNASLLGGKNGFLGGAYILTGLLCVCLGVAFLIRNMVNPRMHYWANLNDDFRISAMTFVVNQISLNNIMSLIYYKFKSAKDFDTLPVDGNGLTVFDVKREIMIVKKLGKGQDFDLCLYNAQTKEEYDDDSVVIPRNTSVLVARKPPQKVGNGTAQRYLSAAVPIMPKMTQKAAIYTKPVLGQTYRPPNPTTAEGIAEKEGISQMFKQQAATWQQTQTEMATVRPIYRAPMNAIGGVGRGGFRPMAMDIEHQRPPPPGYTCFRCGEKGHYINVCPTLGDPDFENKPKIKKATGIPTMFLKTIKNKDAVDRGLMVTGEGDLVVAMPNDDQWKKFTATSRTFKAVDDSSSVPSHLSCFVCKKLVKEAVSSRCCNTPFCDECIRRVLLERGLECPKCKSKMKPDQLNVNYDLRNEADQILRSQVDPSVTSSAPAPSSGLTATAAPIREPRDRDRAGEKGIDSRQRRDRSRSPNRNRR